MIKVIGRMKVFPKLFKYAKSGAVQEWKITVKENADGTAYYTVTYGQVGGALQSTDVEVYSGKNIGRRNETTPFEQACADAESKWKLQLDKGYSKGAPKKLKAISPMLAKSYEKEAAKVTFPCYFQPKLDGVRCIAQKEGDRVTLFSRRLKEFDTLGHISDVLCELMRNGEILDGELYVPGVKFQKLISWIKRKQPDTAKVIYNIYDAISEKCFEQRFKHICELVGHKGRGVVKTVYTAKVNSHKEVKKTLDDQVARGYEGVMLRIGDCKYVVGRRSSQLLKVKEFLDEEFIIVGAQQTKGRQKGQCVFLCETVEGAQFKVKPMGTDEQRRKMWTDSYKLIGKKLTVRFFEWTSSEPSVPRFPVGVAIRDYE